MRGWHSLRGFFLASCAVVATCAPTAAAAQPSTFADGLAAFTAAVEGTYGDEGDRITSALEVMTRSLAAWDEATRALETRVAAEASRVSADRAADLRVTLARTYVDRGRPEDALRQLDVAVAADPARADTLLLRALVLDALDRRTEASTAFRSAWRRDASNPIGAYLLLRRAPTTAGSEESRAARQLLESSYRPLLQDGARSRAFPVLAATPLRVRATDPPVIPPSAYAGGYARIVRGDYAGALVEFRKAVALDPLLDDPAAGSTKMRQAAAALRQQRPAEARALLENADTGRDSSEVHRLLGLAHWLASDDDKSLEHLAIAIERRPRDERARLALARVLSSTGRHDAAARALEDALEALPNAPVLRFWLGSEYERLNRLADARRQLEAAAVGAVAGGGAIHAAIGRLATLAGDAEGAAAAFARAADGNLNDAGAHLALADALLRLDRGEDAFVELVAAAMIDPRHPGVHAALGRLLLDQNRHDEALAALRRALALAPDDVDARYALATALIRTGNTAQGEQELDRVEQAQRRLLDDRRRKMSLEVLEEEALFHASSGRRDQAAALYLRLAEQYGQLGRTLEATRARALYERTREGRPSGQEPGK